ncbi:MAG TPA: hypothetical protein VGZ47_21785 [Gemmataceae bacterium]|nr:hypothetical protein [Gemmataceae bacterium]
MCKPNALLPVALALLVSANLTIGQEANPPAAPKIYSKSVTFRLPVQIDDHDRADLKELKLYMRTPSTAWRCQETAPPTQKIFPFRSSGDGEYWFMFVMVDKNGRAFPENVEQAPPGLVVVVDTQPPEVEVRSITGTSGQVFLYGTILDANPDYAAMKMDYLDGTQWKPLTMLRDCPGAFLDTDPKAPGGKIRVFVADRAGNSATKEVDLPSSSAAPAPVVPAAPAAAPAVPTVAPPVVADPNDFVPSPSVPDVRPVSTSSPTMPDLHENSIAKSLSSVKELPVPSNVPLINSLRCRLDFSVDGKADNTPAVEVWATGDGGRSWQKCGESLLGKSPVLVTFPQDGVYGFLFAAKTTGGELSPRPGSMPDGWVEVDTAKPTVEMHSVKMGAGSEASDLFVTWTARDRNLGADPVSIYYATQASGPWYPLALNVANSGKYRWTVPSGMPRLFVRLEVSDRAGNTTRCETPEAVLVECPRIPVKVLNIVPIADSHK